MLYKTVVVAQLGVDGRKCIWFRKHPVPAVSRRHGGHSS